MSLVIQDLSVHVGDQALLKDISLKVAAGQKVAIMGPNGAGKSTLLSCLSGERRVFSGEVRLDDQPTDHWLNAERAQRLAVMPQSVQVSFPVRTWQVVAMGRYPWGDETSTHQWQQDAMRETDVWHLRDRNYTSLSGGEQQRVQLARVLVQLWQQRLEGGQGCLLLLDECTASLDPAHQHAIMNSTACFAAAGITVLAVMHDTALAASWADQVVLMKDGTIVCEGASAILTETSVLQQTFDLPVSIAQQYACQNAVWIADHS